MTEDPKIIVSPLSRQYTEDGITIDVQIYKLEDGDGWTLELVDEENNSTVWEELFTTDEAAWQEFEAGVKEIGLAALLRATKQPSTEVRRKRTIIYACIRSLLTRWLLPFHAFHERRSGFR